MSSLSNVDRFKQRMRQGKVCIGIGVLLSDPLASEAAAEAGNDFVWIDMEHSHLHLQAVLGHIMALRGTQTAPLVRVPCNDSNIIKPLLDMAPAGIIVPMIRSAEDTRRAVEACRYPPKGIRGYGPVRNMYGKSSMMDYLKSADDEIMVIAHIETIEAVRDIDNILAVPGLDGISLGRNDLSGSMGKLGQHTDPEVLEAIDTLFSKTSQTDLFLGCSIGYEPDTVREWYKKGVRWFSLEGDFGHIYNGSKAVVDAVRKLDDAE